MNNGKEREKEPTMGDILEAIQDFSYQVEKRFNQVDQRFDGVDKRLDGVDGRMEGLETRLSKVEATMVTKDYLDDKLADLRGDLIVIMRKEDKKLHVLLEELVRKGSMSERVAKQILSMEPFPHLIL